MGASRFARRARRERGLALITVMWLVGLLALLATATLQIARNHARMSSRAAQIVAAEAVEDSAIRLTLLQINEPIREEQHLGFSVRWQLRLFDQVIGVRVEREAGRVDLNAADPSLIAAVFIASGADTASADSFASRIVDWRDTDDQPGRGGAELEDYRRAHIGYGPRNRPFESIGEVRQVLGFAELSPGVLDAFTVYSTRSPLIEPEFAHPLVRRGLQLLLQSNPPPGAGTVGPAVPDAPLLVGQVVRIHACLDKSVIKSCRAVIARLTGNPHKPFLIYTWYTEQPLPAE